ncbi:MAG: helix-turn-helix domain-containing protein, partial [Bacteroidota bacterium]|nr:helix-turn-helix domain-containing protein [Bacteroidota bacterium]
MPRPATNPTSRLGRLRQYYGLGQHELAALLGVAPALVSQLESGRRALSRAVAGRLAPFLAPLEAEAAPAPAEALA